MKMAFWRRREWNSGLLLFPVRRKVFFSAWWYLFGILSAPRFGIPLFFALIASSVLVGLTVFLWKTRRSILFPICFLLALSGNLHMAPMLRNDDMATPSRTGFSGTVIAIERDFRVVLKDVRLEDGTALRFPAAVTLLTEEGEEEKEKPTETPQIGQTVSGAGKLFRPEEQRNPGGEDARFRNLARGYWLSGYLIPGWTAEGAPGWSFTGISDAVRKRILLRIDALFGDTAPLYRALLAGDRSGMDAGLLLAMREIGIVHILTVSGMHISILGFVLSWVLKRLRVRGFLRQILVLGCVGVYALAAGFSPGTARAYIMMFIRENSKRTGAKYDPLTALAIAFLALTLFRPALVFTLAFQFSFLIVLGIHLILPSLTSVMARGMGDSRMERPLVRTVLFCISAQLAAIPVQLMGYGYFSFFALPFNLAISFLIPVMIVGGLLCLAISVLLWPPAAFLAWLLRYPALLLERITKLAEILPDSILRLPAPETYTLFFLIAVAALCCPRFGFGKMRRAALIMFAAAAAASYAFRFDPSSRYVQLDVGQGDAAVLRKGRSAVLYDTGPTSDYDLLNYLRHEGLSVDAVFLSHMDADHAGGLLKLLRSEIRIARLVSAETDCGEDAAESVKEAWTLAGEKGIQMDTVAAGCSVQAGSFSFDVLGPTDRMRGDNARSLLLLTEMEGARILLTGDLPSSADPSEIPDAELLKVAHHGSKKSTDMRFLEQASPVLSLISVGAGNSFGHPSDRVLSDLETIGSAVFRTDECGCITVYPGPCRLRVQPFLKKKDTVIEY